MRPLQHTLMHPPLSVTLHALLYMMQALCAAISWRLHGGANAVLLSAGQSHS